MFLFSVFSFHSPDSVLVCLFSLNWITWKSNVYHVAFLDGICLQKRLSVNASKNLRALVLVPKINTLERIRADYICTWFIWRAITLQISRHGRLSEMKREKNVKVKLAVNVFSIGFTCPHWVPFIAGGSGKCFPSNLVNG